jgi:hypothetical protein
MGTFNFKNSNVGQVSNSGDNFNISNPVPQKSRSLWDHFCAWYGIVGTTVTFASALMAWYALHLQYGWWFFGAK